MPLTNPNYLLDGTWSGKNMVAAVSLYQYTALANVKVTFIIGVGTAAKPAAGGGDYVFYIQHQWLGIGTSRPSLPKTTVTAAAGETQFEVQSMGVQLKAGDVIDFMGKGLAGDGNVNGTIRIIQEQPSVFDVTADNVLVSALNGITSLAAWLRGMYLKAAMDATAQAEVGAAYDPATDSLEANRDNIGTAGAGLTALVTAIWANATRTLTSFGTYAAEVWSYGSRTLTQAIASVTASLSGDGIAITIGDTWEHSVTGLSSNTDYVSIDFMVKKNKLDDDVDAIIWIRKNASGLTDGLLYLEGATTVSPVVAADGSITVDSSTGLTFILAARAGAELEKRDGLYYGVKYIFANSTQTVLTGICNIDYGIIHAIE